MNKKRILAMGSAAVGSLVVAVATTMAAEPVSLSEFATRNVGWFLEAEVPLQEKLGAVAFRGDRVGAPQGLDTYVDFNARKFDGWCRKQGGKVTYDSGDGVIGKTAGFLWPTQATKQDASWVCSAKDGTAIAAVLRGATREVQVKHWGGGMIPAYEFRYAFFDGPSWVSLPQRRDEAFAAYEARQKEAAAALAAAEKADNEKWELETARLRSEPKVGDWTSLGLIVEVKPPLVLIQVKADRREARNASQEWVEIKRLRAPSR